MTTRHTSKRKPRAVITVKEAHAYVADKLGLTGLYKALHRGDFPHHRAGFTILIPRREFLQWVRRKYSRRIYTEGKT